MKMSQCVDSLRSPLKPTWKYAEKGKFPMSGKLFWKTDKQLNCFVNIDNNAIVYLHFFEKHTGKRFLTLCSCVNKLKAEVLKTFMD